MTKEKTKKEKVEEKTEEQPTLETEHPKPIDFSKILSASQKCMPELMSMLKPKKKDPSTMCEFTIKGNDQYVLNCLSLILG